MKNLFCFLLASLLLLNSASAQSPIVHTRYGNVKGYAEEGIRIFKGIPFAAPPVGALRWKAPQPPASWTGIKKCTAFSASPIQSSPVPFSCWTEEFIAPPSPLSEDCLYLNIWSGAKSSKEKRPVFVWIYGGGFNSGSAACAIYDGKEYAKRGIVFVSINYRVGALGFMAHPELTKEASGTSGNYGLLDQVAALQWIKANIAAFGGDPAQVTIAGQSAGSMSVNALITTPLAAGLFQRAIGESGGILGIGIPLATLAAAEESGTKLQSMLGAKDLADMRALPADSILHLSQKMGGIRFAPILDGRVLPVDIAKAFREKKFNPVSFLSGWVTGDGALFGNAKTNPEQFEASVRQRYGDKADKILGMLPHSNADEATRSQERLNLLSFGVVSPCRLAAFNPRPSYVYEFSHVPVDKPGFPNYGAFHTSEVPYALHTLHTWIRPWKELDYTLQSTMSAYWIQFVKTGNPNGKGLPPWPAFNGDRILSLGDVVEEKPNSFRELVALFQ